MVDQADPFPIGIPRPRFGCSPQPVRAGPAPPGPRSRPLPGQDPVYPDLAGRLIAGPPPGAEAAFPDRIAAHVLAVLAGYAYSDLDTVGLMMTRMGLPGARIMQISQDVNAMFISSSCYVVQSADGRLVLVAYRGTDPGPAVSWLTDFDVRQESVRLSRLPPHAPSAEPAVHGGFYRNVRATRYQVATALGRAARGLPIDPKDESVLTPAEAVYLTGHSLGGAMAVLMAAMTATDDDLTDVWGLVRAVYTYGQPMVGNAAFAKAIEALGLPMGGTLGTRIARYVYNRDVVPSLPPMALGSYAHTGAEFHWDKCAWNRAKSSRGQVRFAFEVALSVGGFLGAQSPSLDPITRLTRYTLADHMPHHYVTALAPPGPTEFGDDFFLHSGCRDHHRGARAQ
jgi:hypothetical protein